jgi:plasmid replication initiation protein
MQIEKVMEYTAPNDDPEFDIPKSLVMDGKKEDYIKKVCLDLCRKELLLNEDDPNVDVHILMPFREIISLKNENIIHIRLDRTVAGIFYEIKKGYSKIDYHSALSLTSYHAQKLYEIFSMKINGYDHDETAMWCTTVDEVKKILGIEGKYKDGRDFKKRVLETTQKQLENTDLEISYDLERKGRSYHFLTFYINRRSEKSDFEQVEIALEDDKSKRCLTKLIDLGVFDKKIQKTIIEQYQQAFWKWNHAVKIGAVKPNINAAGHLLKTLGLK